MRKITQFSRTKQLIEIDILNEMPLFKSDGQRERERHNREVCSYEKAQQRISLI